MQKLIPIVLLIAAAPAVAQDQVVLLRGTPVSGTIVEVSPTEVVVEARGKKQRVPVNNIRRVSFREDPTELKRARDKILIGKYAAGLADLQKVTTAEVRRDESKLDVQFYLAFARGQLVLTEGGDKPAATTELLNFIKRNPSSFHFFETAELLGKLAVAQDSYEDAVKYFRAIGTKAPWPDLKIRASILEGRARLAQQQFAAAQALFEGVDDFKIDTPEATRQKQFAIIGRAVCLAEQGSHEQAQQVLTDLISQTDPQDTELFGHAYNGLGRCHLKADRPKDALLAYLHVDILFDADPEVHAESLYHLSSLWKTVNRSDRATSVRRLLAEKYSGSKWAKRE